MPHARRWRATTLLRSPTLQCHPERGCRAVYAKRFLFLRTESAGVSRRKCCSNRPPAYDIGLLVLRHLIHYRCGAEGCRRHFRRASFARSNYINEPKVFQQIQGFCFLDIAKSLREVPAMYREQWTSRPTIDVMSIAKENRFA